MNKTKSVFKTIILILIPFAVWGLWVGLELIMYGEIQPRSVDNIMGLILIASLYINCLYLVRSTTPTQIFELISLKIEKLSLNIADIKEERIIEKRVFEDCKEINNIINDYPISHEDVVMLLRSYGSILTRYRPSKENLESFLKETVNEETFINCMAQKYSF